MVTVKNITAVTSSIYSGDTFRKAISAIVAAAAVPVYILSFDFFAMFITGAAIRATTAGLIPLKILITDGLS